MNAQRLLVDALSLTIAIPIFVSIATVQAATLSAGDVTAAPGQTAAVPITIDTGADSVAFFAMTLIVVPQGGAPPVASAMTYQAAAGLAPPDVTSADPASGELVIGYVVTTLSPPLSGTVVVGTLMVPVPAAAAGSYDVQLSKISAGDSSGNQVVFAGVTGTIALIGGTTPAATTTPGPTAAPSAGADTLSAGTVSGNAGQTAAVPITINTGADNVAFFGVTFSVVPQDGAPAIADKLTYRAAPPLAAPFTNNAVTGSLAIGYLVDISPPLTGMSVVGTLMVPIPISATGSYQVQLSKISAGNALGNKVILFGESGGITVLPPFTPTETPTPTPTNTPTPTPPCIGDCSRRRHVTVDDILTMVNIALGKGDVSTCDAGDANFDGQISIAEILLAVHNALDGCFAGALHGEG